jgi:uncharacterized protein (TIGR02145 family)
MKYIFFLLSITLIFSCKKESNIPPYSDGSAVTDVDGNIYQSVNIGNQSWFSRNLDVIHYRNGDIIPNVTDPVQWRNMTTGAWKYYNNDPALGAIYGKLYNWYAVNDPRGLAPNGWSIPSKEDWSVLTDFLGGWIESYRKMKEVGTEHWLTNEDNVTNESKFTSIPSGLYFYQEGVSLCDGLGIVAYYWSSTEAGDTTAYEMGVPSKPFYNVSGMDCDKHYGFSIRCVSPLNYIPNN